MTNLDIRNLKNPLKSDSLLLEMTNTFVKLFAIFNKKLRKRDFIC